MEVGLDKVYYLTRYIKYISYSESLNSIYYSFNPSNAEATFVQSTPHKDF